MNQRNISHITGVCVLAGILSGFSLNAGAFSFSFSNSSSRNDQQQEQRRPINNRPWGNIGSYKPAMKYEPPPVPDMQQYGGMMPGSQYLGSAPGTGWYAAQIPGIGQPSAGGEPAVEVDVSEDTLYEQQNTVYTVRVVSSDNLRTLNPVIPQIDDALLEQVDGPVASTRTTGRNNREIVNQYRFKLTPLRAGEIVVPAIRFTGTHAASRQWQGSPGRQGPAGAPDKGFSIAAMGPLKLDVLPADPSSSPWLPLHDLRLQVQLSESGPVKAGVPVTLTLELAAKGALGTQLPSLQEQLRNGTFRAYRDAVATSGGISRDGTRLLGSRKETYTLIPLQDGRIQLPAIQVAWWNVDTDTPMVAGLSGQRVASGGAVQRPGAVTAAGEQEFMPAYFWVPMLLFLGLIIGYWLGAWVRTRPLLHAASNRARGWLSGATDGAIRHVAAAGRRISPMPYLGKLRIALAFVMPRTVKVWMCMRCINREERPEAWCTQFRRRVCGHLDISRHTPLTAIAEKLIEVQSVPEPARLRTLAQTMDNAVYGGAVLDFNQWKQEFRQQLRPRLFGGRRPRRRRTGINALPALNPHVT